MKVHAKCMHCGAHLDRDALDSFGTNECEDVEAFHDYDVFDPMGEQS